MATITSLSFNVFTRYRGDGMRQARRDINRTQRAIDGLHARNRALSSSLGSLAVSAAALTPALAPIGAVVAGIGAGFGALGVTVGASLGLYGALMKTAYSDTLSLWAADQKLNNAQTALIKSSGEMLESWHHLANMKKVLWPMADVFWGLHHAIDKLPPLVESLYPVVKKTTQAFQEWASGDGMQRFVNILVKHAAPALDAILQGSRNALAALGIGFRTALPLIQPVTSAIERGGLAFRVWAEGGGFKRFLQIVQANGPAVKDFFKQLVTAVGHLMQAMAGLGPVTLLTVTGFLRLINALPLPVLQGIILAFVAWRICMIANAIAMSWNVIAAGALWIAVGALYVVIGIVAAATAVWTAIQWALNTSFLGCPVLWLIIGIMAIVAAIVLIATKTTWFQTAWTYTWNFIKAVTGAVWSWLLNSVFYPIGRFFTQTIPRWATTVKNWVVGAWQSISNRLTAVGVWLMVHVFGPIGRFFTQTIPRWASTVKNWVVGAWQAISNRLTGVAHWLMNHVFAPIGRFFTQTIPRWATTVKNWVVGAWQAISNRVSGVWQWMRRNIFNPIGHFFTKTIPGWAGTVKRKIVSAWELAVNGVKKAWNWLKKIVKEPINIAIGFINTGIIDVWNKVAKFVGLKQQGKIKKLATGGPVQGPGTGTSDDIPAMLSNNEHVWTAREVAAAGGHTGVAALRAAVLRKHKVRKMGTGDGAYADGGGAIAPKPPKLKGAGGSTGRKPQNYDPNAKNVFQMAGDLVRGSIGAIANPILDKIKSWIADKVGGGKHGSGVRKIMAKAAVKPIEWIQSWIDNDDAKHAFANGFTPWKTWRGDSDARRVQWRGKTFNVRTVAMLKNAEKIYKHRLSIMQGSWSHAKASAGTHSGGGAVDAGPAKDAVVGALRASGFAAWRRTPKEHFSPHVHGIAVGDPTVSKGARSQVVDFFKGLNGLANKGPDTYMGGAGGAGRWRGLVGQVLKELKLHSGTNVNNVLKAIAKESGGNPRAVNRGDVNARNGDPSKGLLQVIGSTFRRYAGKYKSRGQFDPHANIYAGVNYAHHRYGKRWSQRMAAPGGYFAGIRSAPQGPAWVGERGPELMNFRGGESVTPVTVGAGVGSECNHYHFDNQGTIYTKSSREFEDMLATAMQELSRKGKLPKK